MARARDMVACALGVSALAGGCEQPVAVTPQEEAPLSAPALAGGAVIPEGSRGVEVRVVPVIDGAVGAALAPYEGVPVGADPVMLLRWRRAGLRLIAIPDEDLDRALAPLRPARRVEASWWGSIPNWRALAVGPRFERLAVDTGAGVRTIGPGRLRLLARAWFEPAIRDGAIAEAARIELVPQVGTPPARPGLSDLGASPAVPGAGDEGEAFGSLGLGFVASAGRAYVIVGESPDADWRDPEARGGDASASFGPEVPRVRALGEAMLCEEPPAPPKAGAGEPTRLVEPVRVMIVIRTREGGGGAG